MLEVKALCAGYGDVAVLHDVSLRVERGEIVTLIGANGAGKTTLLRTISRLVDTTAGSIVVKGENVTAAPSTRVVALGAAHVPEGRRLWPEMTVEDNLLLGAYPARAAATRSKALQRVFELFPRVRERRHQSAGTLSGGEQQMVAIGRGLMSSPEMLMLDEPSLGLAPIVVSDLFATIAKINAAGVTILLVEQNTKQALELATRGYVIENGAVKMSGPCAQLLDSELVKKAYLGL